MKRIVWVLASLFVMVGVNLAGAWPAAAATTAATFGGTGRGTSIDTPGAGYKFGSVYALSVSATLTDFKFYAGGGTSSQSFVTAIYSTDATSTPTNLVAKGTAVTIPAGRAPGWVTSTLPNGITIAPGNYMLALLSGDTWPGAHIYFTPGASNAGIWNPNAYPNPSSTWGQVNFETQHWSFYVDYKPTAAPANVTPPTISGTPVVGHTVTASTGTWTGSPTGFAYTWQRCKSGVCPNITNASASSYPVSAADVGSTLQVAVTATNSSGSSSKTSKQTAVVTSSTGPVEEPFAKSVIDPNPPGAVVEKTFADINGDGRLDAVVGTETSPNLPGSQGGIFWYQYPQSGNPNDPWIRHTIVSGVDAYEDMVAVDVNHDGRADIIATVGGSLSWFTNPGTPNGTWQQNFIGQGNGEDSITVGDFDGDGKLDIATNSFVFFQNTPTSWTTVPINTGSFLGSAALDIGSGKGSIDVVGNSPNAPYDIVWLENPREHGGNARTDPWVMHTVGPGYVCSGGLSQCDNGMVATVATGDLNGDGRMDIMVGQSEGSPSPPGGLKWYQAPADRTQPWIEHDIDTSFQATHNIRVADMNGDGKLDFVTGEQDQSAQHRIAVFYNDGAGNFTEQVISNDGTHNVSLGDTTGDGDIDILASQHGYFGGSHPLELFVNGRF